MVGAEVSDRGLGKPDFIIRATEATGKAEGCYGLIPSWKSPVGYRGQRVGRGELPGRRCQGPAERQAAPVSSGSRVDEGAGGEDAEEEGGGWTWGQESVTENGS